MIPLDTAWAERRMAAMVAYLARRQQPDGEFPTLRSFPGEVPGYVAPSEFEGWYGFGKCPFCTANVVLHLADVDLAGIAEIRRKGCESLAAGMENGVARYVPSSAKPADFPTDVDDTCLAAAALESNGFPSGCNVGMVLDNVTGDGDVFTWLVPRWRHARHPGNLLWLVRDRRSYTRRMEGYGTPATRLAAIEREYRVSLEPGVAANVLLYLGAGRRTRKLLRRLIERIERDDMPPGYYASLTVAYFHVARLHAKGVTALAQAKGKILGYLGGLQREDGEVENAFHTALAALCFMYFDEWGAPALAKAVEYVARHPMHEDGWKPLHYCNDLDGVFVDGGAELTAALYLEVLYRWQRRPPRGGGGQAVSSPSERRK